MNIIEFWCNNKFIEKYDVNQSDPIAPPAVWVAFLHQQREQWLGTKWQ